MIVDLSAPHNKEAHESINELIDNDDFFLNYVKIDDVIRLIMQKGRGAQLCKTDITNAVKLLTIHSSLWPCYGIWWRDQFSLFVRTIFGSWSSPKICDAIPEAMCRIATKHCGIEHLFHLLDDFFNILFLPIDSPGTRADPHQGTLVSDFQ